MLGLTKTLASRLQPVVGIQVCAIRRKGTVPIITISPPQPYTDLTMGPYPRTPEERLRAARKYNLIPEDYEPYDEDEGWGDYPKLPAIGAYNKDKYDDFDDVHEYRHYGEPLQLNADLYTWERIDPLESKKIPPLLPYWKRAVIFFTTMAVIPVYYYTCETFGLHINQNHKCRLNHNQPRYEFPPSPNDFPHHHGGHH